MYNLVLYNVHGMYPYVVSVLNQFSSPIFLLVVLNWPKQEKQQWRKESHLFPCPNSDVCSETDIDILDECHTDVSLEVFKEVSISEEKCVLVSDVSCISVLLSTFCVEVGGITCTCFHLTPFMVGITHAISHPAGCGLVTTWDTIIIVG